jgi:hypothetical protein
MSSSPVASLKASCVPGGKASCVHLGHQALQHLGIALQEPHQGGAVGLPSASHLGDAHFHDPLGGADAPRLVAVAGAPLALSPALVAAPAAQEVCLLCF